MVDGRLLSNDEQSLVDALLATPFEGVEALREQAKVLLARPGCTCGCGTIDLLPQGDLPRSTAAGLVPSEGRVRNPAGEELGGLLFVRHGLLESLEIYSHYGDPLPLPLIVDVTFVA